MQKYKIMTQTGIVALIIILSAILGVVIYQIAKCIRDIAFIRHAKKTGNPIYQKHGLVMSWEDHETGCAKSDYTIVTPH